MQIKRLRLSGFKSFVDPADLRIEPGLTGIVGPNGCGKSNLLEALRWAMGENSPRSMRGSGMEDVIFAGTAARPQRDFAEVSILTDEVAGEAEGEVEVVRRIERGAGSAYRINGRDVRAKDVSLLFADAATGAHSPALVSQGRISAVISAKPVERRAMLEEAAGIAGLHVRRKDAEQRLRATENNLTRLDEVIADQDARAAALKRQARQAERYRALTEDIRVAEARMIYARWRDAAAAADAAKAEAAAAEARVTERAAGQDKAAEAQRRAAERLSTERAAALAVRDRASEAMHRLSALRGDRASVDRRLQELADNEVRLAADKGREGELARDAAEALSRLEEEAGALDKRIAEAATRMPQLESALAEAERVARDAEVSLAQAMAEQASEAADARVAQAALDAARTRVERAERDKARVDAERKALPDAGPLQQERDSAARARETALQQAETGRTGLSRADAAERAAIEARDKAQSARAGAHAELAQLDSEAAALTKATRASARDRLLDRLKVDDGYERALAAALGDDLEAGLDSSAERYWAGAETLPGDPGAPADATPLAAHVQAPPELARRLSQVFVTESDTGQKLAVGQRLATLDGKLRRWDGYTARSGGAAAAQRLESVNRLHAIEKARPAALRAVESAEARLSQIEEDIAEARRAAADARRVLEHAETTGRDAARAEDRAASQLERLEAQRADIESRAQRIAGEVEEAASEQSRAQAALAALPDGQQTRERVSKLSSDTENRRAAAAAARAERTAQEQELSRARERLAAAQAERKSWQARAGEAARRSEEMETRAAALAQEKEQLAARPAELDGLIAEAERTAETTRAESSAAQAAEAEAEAALRITENEVRLTAERLAEAREIRAGAAARAENQEARRIEMGRLSGERFECPPPILGERVGFETDTVGEPGAESATHDKLIAERERIGPVNLVAETELAELSESSAANAKERDELTLAVNQLRGSIGTLNREGRQRLLAAFEAVNDHFTRLFTTLFNGGSAHLELIDSEDPLEAGLEIMAQPPGKKLQSLTLLSGGEQALTAVALIFALFLTNPAPICVLDEVDAPLDDANIERFCDLLDRMNRETRTRYLIVTHNAATMARMDRLFGVTMVERGVSRLVSVDLGGAESLLAAE
ncbi:chromosome segregation protein SMC [Stakelama tenebrarum]|uniref:Chromosome partition protein Smc n=1 Tax=Stakelama tenebrarum TaxID=2711215 RepID=A0A6G6Y0I4_9SPHN|nr:chromosome segregation protein SMC [Sphingosinithalassobacter tenebrarum]QIG78454.1 chromosome segregation protein SMC [Sphingosinithalassobacter tenebrarum]